MTAVDHAELKRVAEGATPGKWVASVSGLPEWRNVEYFVESDHPGVNEGDTLVCTTNAPDSRDAAFIAAANPAVVLELLSEIEGLKARFDDSESKLSDVSNQCGLWIAARDEQEARAGEAERQLAALRTQAPDSWRPIETAPKPGIEFQVWWKEQWQPRARFNPETHAFELWGRTDYDTEGWECFSFTDATHWMPEPKAPLRPQTAESGK